MDFDELFDELDAIEEERNFRQKPTCYTFRGSQCHIEQSQFPNDITPTDSGMQVWPAAVALAQYLEKESLREDMDKLMAVLDQYKKKGETHMALPSYGVYDAPQGRTVLELGSGMGLVGLAAASLGASRVLLTDVEDLLPHLKRNAELNLGHDRLEVRALDWKNTRDAIAPYDKQFDVVCCSDCFNWPELFEPFFEILDELLNKQNFALLAIVNRSAESARFLHLLKNRMHFEQVWSSSSDDFREEGYINICRVRKHSDSLSSSSEYEAEGRTQRTFDGVLSNDLFERVLQLPAKSIAEVAVAKKMRRAHTTVMRVRLTPSAEVVTDDLDTGISVPASVFIKQVRIDTFVKFLNPESFRAFVDSTSLIQDITSYRTEVNWYCYFNERLRELGVPLPRCYIAHNEGEQDLGILSETFADLLSDTFESSDNQTILRRVEDMQPSVIQWKQCEQELMHQISASENKRFVYILEDFCDTEWTQQEFLSETCVRAALGFLVDLHASTVGDANLLERAQEKLHENGTYWAPCHRPPWETAGLDMFWDDFVSKFGHLDKKMFRQERILSLGRRLKEAQADVDENLRGSKALAGGLRGLSLVHGDFRCANIFFSRRDPLKAAAVAFRWSGVGFGAQDVASLLLTSADMSVLSKGIDLQCLIESAYLRPLQDRVGSLAPGHYEFFHTFRLACLDYSKVVWGFHLNSRVPAWVEAAGRGGAIGWATHNRSFDHILGLVRFVDKLLQGAQVPGFVE